MQWNTGEQALLYVGEDAYHYKLTLLFTERDFPFNAGLRSIICFTRSDTTPYNMKLHRTFSRIGIPGTKISSLPTGMDIMQFITDVEKYTARIARDLTVYSHYDPALSREVEQTVRGQAYHTICKGITSQEGPLHTDAKSLVQHAKILFRPTLSHILALPHLLTEVHVEQIRLPSPTPKSLERG